MEFSGPTKELDVMLHGLAIESMQHGMASPVGRACAAVGLAASAVIQRLPAKRPLVDLPVLSAGERQPVVL